MVDPDARDAMRDLIEPGAIAARPDHDGQIRLSVAISLKRIADVINAPGLDFHTINSNVEQMAWNAGRSFQHGTRTDR